MIIRKALFLAIGLGLCSPLLAAPIAPGAAAAVPPEEFRIMTDQEIADHKAKMATLAGTAREEYRNAQYEILKKRALAQGYQLPDVPPWGRTELVPAPMPEEAPLAITPPAVEPPKPADLPKLIEEQRKVVEAAIAAAEEDAAAAPVEETPKAAAPVAPIAPAGAAEAPQPSEPQATPAPAVAADFQQRMRQRFERFRAERAARQAKLAEQRRQRFAEWQRQQQAMQRRMPPRMSPQMPPQMPMAPPGYRQPPAYGYPQMPMRPAPMPQVPYRQPYHGFPQGYPQGYPQPPR